MGTVIVTPGVPATVEITQDVPTAVQVASVGVQGIPGPTGPPGTTDHLSLSNIGTRTHAQLETGIDAKLTGNVAIIGGTKTKITYDAKGLVTSGADATTADISDSTNKRYVTDAGLVVLGNTSGINTGDQDLSGFVPYNGATNNVALGTFSLLVGQVAPSLDATYNLGLTGASWLDANILVLNDSSGVFSISPNLRELREAGGTTVLNWATQCLIDQYNVTSIDWMYRNLYNYSGNAILNYADVGNVGNIKGGNGLYSFNLETATLTNNTNNTLNWNTMDLIDSGSSIVSVAWGARQLINSSSSTMLDWYDAELYAYANLQLGSNTVFANQFAGSFLTNSYNQLLIATDYFAYYDGFSNIAINMHSRQLIDSSGSFVSVDWSSRWLTDAANVTSIDWANRYVYDSGAVLSQDWANRECYDSTSVISISYEGRYLYDQNSVASVGWNDRVLVRTNNTQSVDWNNNILRDASAVTSVHYGNRQLVDSGGTVAQNWNSRETYDVSSVRSINYNLRTLYSNTNTLMADWSAAATFVINAAATTYPLGTAAAPSITFVGDVNTGMYSPAADQIGFAGGGVVRFQIFAAGVESAAQVRGAGGSAGTPTFCGANDTNTGMFFLGSDVLAISTNATEAIRIGATQNVGIGGTANANAILDVASTTKAFMPPRMTTTQKNAIASPTSGMIVYDSTLNKLCVYGAASWQTITSV